MLDKSPPSSSANTSPGTIKALTLARRSIDAVTEPESVTVLRAIRLHTHSAESRLRHTDDDPEDVTPLHQQTFPDIMCSKRMPPRG
jgi:hypothetical protein